MLQNELQSALLESMAGFVMHPLCLVFGIGLAGGLGSLARYGVGLSAAALFGTAYPYGTFCVNILGSFLFGAGIGVFAALPAEWTAWKTILLTGFLGGFTTFSAFAFENYQFWEQQRYAAFAVHVFGQNILGIAAVFAGIFAASCAVWR